MRDFGTKIDNTAPNESGILTADEDNVRFREMENIVTSAAITLDGASGPDNDLNMLAQAIARYASGGVVCQDTGGVNTHVLSSVGQFVLPKAYFKGMVVMFYPAATNSGAATVNVNSIGAKQIYNSIGAALVAGDLVISTFTMMSYDPALNSGAGAFKLSPWSMPMRSVGDGVAVYEGLSAGRHKFRSIMAGTNITVDLVESPASSGEYKLRITSTGGGGGGTLTDGDKGDVTVTSAGAVWTIDDSVVTNAKLANMAPNLFKARLSGSGAPQDITGSQAVSIMPLASAGVRGVVTPDGDPAHYLNGAGAWTSSQVIDGFSVGAYYMASYRGDDPNGYIPPALAWNTTKTKAQWAAINIAGIPGPDAGVWANRGATPISESVGSGGTSESHTMYLVNLQRIG